MELIYDDVRVSSCEYNATYVREGECVSNIELSSTLAGNYHSHFITFS